MQNSKSHEKRRVTERDQAIAWHVWRRRVAAGMSQPELARRIDIAYQQINRYENCTNRISAGRLAEIAEALETPIEYFFRPLPSGALEKRAA